jgi:hypothetical protein
MISPLYLESKADKPVLRVAVLLDQAKVPRWVATILEDLARCNFARVELVVVQDAGEGAQGGLAQRLPALADAVYARVNHALVGEHDPGVLVDPSVWLLGVDRVAVPVAGEDGALRLPLDALAELARRDLDVILRFCTAVPRGEVLQAARCGVWSFHHCADGSRRGRRPLFREIVAGATTLDVQLEVLADEPGRGLVLCQSTFAQHGSIFDALHRQVPTWETTHFVLWKLHDLHALGWEHVQRQAVPQSPAVEAAAPAKGAIAADVARMLLPRFTSGVRRLLQPQPPRVHRWQIALRTPKEPLYSASGARDASDFRWLEAPKGHYWADPFLFERDGRTYLFFEDYVYDRDFAGISQAEVFADGTLGPASSCLDPGFHLSFPHVFEHEGEIFMLPESLANGTITLYRAARFPNEWVQEKVLFHGNATDTTLWREGGKFYFFTTLFDRDDRGMKTLLFVADSLTGAWRMHPSNPISSDVRDARGAGAIFRRDGRLFRPVQNCGPCYGYGFTLEEVLTITPEHYEERPFCWVDPSGLSVPAQGVHTYNLAGKFEVIDSYTMGPRPK